MSPSSRRARGVLTAALLTGLFGSLSPAAEAADPLQGATQLRGGAGFPIGDFNGDGLGDLADSKLRIVFGTRSPENLDLDQDLGAKGTKLIPKTALSSTTTVSELGDVDDDGFDDVAVIMNTGTSSVQPDKQAFVVYGAAGNAPVTLQQGPRVGVVGTGTLGGLATALGDFNGDGIDDFSVWRQIGDMRPNYTGSVNHGFGIVLGGARIGALNGAVGSARVIQVSASGSCSKSFATYYLWWQCQPNFRSYAAAGDVDDDGKADVFVAAGASRWLVRGRSSTAAINALAPTDAVQIKGTGGEADAVGDVNADGRDDIVIDQALFLGRPSLPALLDPAAANAAITDVQLFLIGAGDLDGDGKDDLALSTKGATIYNELRTLTDVASRGALVSAAAGTAVPGVGTESWAKALGDFDGDGLADLVVDTDYGPRIIRRGPDRAAPQFERGDRSLSMSSVAFIPGVDQPVKLAASLREGATVRFDVKTAGGSLAGSFTRQLSDDITVATWDGTTNAGVLPAGDYTITGVPIDAAGNQGEPSKTIAFTIKPGADGAGRATIRLTSTLKLPDGGTLNPPGTTRLRVDCDTTLADMQGFDQINGTTSTPDLQGPRNAGDRCWFETFDQPVTTEYAGCNWNAEWYHAGVRMPMGQEPQYYKVDRPELTLNAGVNEVELRWVCTGGIRRPADLATPFSANEWLSYGSGGDYVNAETRRLTPAVANANTSFVFRKALNPNDAKYSFVAQATAGNGAAEGLTLSFIPATNGTPPARWTGSAPGFLGAGGGGLGIGGTGATVVAFDLSRGTTGPADQFIGVSDSTMTSGSLNYQQTALAGHKLRGTAFKVDVVHKNGLLTVATNGVVRLTRAMSLPSSAYLAFTASTGATVYQVHSVANFAMTRP